MNDIKELLALFWDQAPEQARQDLLDEVISLAHWYSLDVYEALMKLDTTRSIRPITKDNYVLGEHDS